MTGRRRLLVGSGNPSKIARWGAIFADHDVVGPADVGLILDVPEGETTVVGNARKKALAYSAASGLVTLAEDAGLRITALGDFPGVELRTWGGQYPDRLDDRTLARLLTEALREADDTSALFDVGVAVASPDGFVLSALDESPGYFDLELLDDEAEAGNPLSSAFVSRATGRPWTEMIEMDDRPPAQQRFAREVRSLVTAVFAHVDGAGLGEAR